MRMSERLALLTVESGFLFVSQGLDVLISGTLYEIKQNIVRFFWLNFERVLRVVLNC